MVHYYISIGFKQEEVIQLRYYFCLRIGQKDCEELSASLPTRSSIVLRTKPKEGICHIGCFLINQINKAL